MVLNNAPISSSFTSFPILGNLDDLGPATRSRFDDLTTSTLHADDDIVAPEALLDGDAIEDLLASLGENNIDQVSANSTDYFPVDHEEGDKHNTQELLSDAYGFIQQTTSSSIGPEEGTKTLFHAVRSRRSKKKDDIPDFLRSDNEEDESSSDEEKDEAEAAKYVEDLLKDLQANPPTESPPDQEEDNDDDDANSKGNRENSNDNDDDLSNRLAALSLPSVPNDQPTSNRSAYNRKENESPECCCICYDNAKLKCLDCEGDQLFCVRCWWEMHGDLGGSEGHKAVKYEATRI